MLPNILFPSLRDGTSRKKTTNNGSIDGIMQDNDVHLPYSVPIHSHLITSKSNHRKFALQTENPKHRGIKKMASKVSNFSDLIQRVTASCLLHPLVAAGRDDGDSVSRGGDDSDSDDKCKSNGGSAENTHYEDAVEIGEIGDFKISERGKEDSRSERIVEMEMILGEVFESVSAMKKAYVSLQDAHCPWDPDKMRAADVAVVAELRRIGVLKERYRRSGGDGGDGGRGRRRVGAATLREVVAPYEAVVDELKREVKAKEGEIQNLKEKLKTASSLSHSSSGSGKKGKSKRKVGCSTQSQVAVPPAPELLESTMGMVNEASKFFTALLLSLMRSAHWDISAAVRSIEAASITAANAAADAVIGTNHAKYALESYITRKMFQGFDHETFYMDGSLSSLLRPDQHRRDCFAQFRDMKAMDPVELLGILPTCGFGNFCFKKFLAIVHPKMEESLFGDLEQRRLVLAGNHPRTQFYGEFLELAKAVWLLHLLAFSIEPPPSHFEASSGSEFHPQYMASVVKSSGGRLGMGLVVGFGVSPGFKLANGSVIKARVYLIPKTGF